MYFDEGGRHYEIAHALKKEGFNPTVFCSNTLHTRSEEINLHNKLFDVKLDKDVPFVFVKSTPYTGNGLSRVRNMVTFAMNLYRVGKVYAQTYEKPDIIIASSVHPLTLVSGVKLAKKFKVPNISEVRDLWPEAIFQYNQKVEKSIIGKILVKGEKWIYENSDSLIFTKEGDRDYLHEKGWTTEENGKIKTENVHYINNGVNLEKFDELVIKNKIHDSPYEDAKFNVVYVGSIRPVNNIDNILEAAKILQDHEDIDFLIYGEGSEKKRLEEEVVKFGMSNVHFKGFVKKSSIPSVLSKSSVNLLNYSDKQFNWKRGNSSNKLFEYMASGKPIIATMKMGYSPIKRYQCGIELENNTPIDLAKAILQIKQLDQKQYSILSNNAREGSKDFDFKALTQNLIEIIEEVSQ